MSGKLEGIFAILEMGQLNSPMKLTTRERQLLDSAANGKTDREISDELNISIETVSSYWRGIRLKFQASSRTECVARYSEQKSAYLVVKHELESTELLKEIKTRTEAQARELAQKNMLAAITEGSLSYITGRTSLKECFEVLLQDVINFSYSEYGFMGEVLYEGKTPYLKEHAITNIAWNDATRELYDKHHAEGLEFRNLDTLFGEVMRTGKVVIANKAPTDPRAKGIPEGHPALNSFLGIPVFNGDQLVGMIGLGNRNDGYTQDVVEELRPIIVSCANFIIGYRIENERKSLLQTIANSRAVVLNLIDNIPAGLIYESPDQVIEFVNETFIQMFGLNVKPNQLVGINAASTPIVDRQLLVDPHGFDRRLKELMVGGKSVGGDILDLVDGRRFQRDFVVMESEGEVRGYLYYYRDITRKTYTRATDRLEDTDRQSHI